MADGGVVPNAPPNPAPAPAPNIYPAQQGGLDGIPVPDTMFDENRNGGFNDGYAGGGLVAFAGGGSTKDRWWDAIVAQENGGKYTGVNTQGSGAMGKYQLMAPTARALAKRLGLSYRPDLLTTDTPESRQYQDALGAAARDEAWSYGGGDTGRASAYYQAGPSKQGGPNNRKYVSDIERRLGHSTERETSTRVSMPGVGFEVPSDEVYKQRVDKMFSTLPDDGSKEYAEKLRESINPEQLKKDKKQDMWMALAEIGAGMAASNSPNFLSAVGEAMHNALPGVQSRAKERKDSIKEAQKALVAIGAANRAEARELAKTAFDLREADLRHLSHAEDLRVDIAEKQKDRESNENISDARVAAALAGAEGKGSAKAKEFEVQLQIAFDYLKAQQAAGLPIYRLKDGKPTVRLSPSVPGRPLADAVLRQAAVEMVMANAAYRASGEGRTASDMVNPAGQGDGAPAAGARQPPSPNWGPVEPG